jgi:hypothetical protein
VALQRTPDGPPQGPGRLLGRRPGADRLAPAVDRRDDRRRGPEVDPRHGAIGPGHEGDQPALEAELAPALRRGIAVQVLQQVDQGDARRQRRPHLRRTHPDPLSLGAESGAAPGQFPLELLLAGGQVGDPLPPFPLPIGPGHGQGQPGELPRDLPIVVVEAGQLGWRPRAGRGPVAMLVLLPRRDRPFPGQRIVKGGPGGGLGWRR